MLLSHLLLDILGILCILKSLPLQLLVLIEGVDGNNNTIVVILDQAVIDKLINHRPCLINCVDSNIHSIMGLFHCIKLRQLGFNFSLPQLFLFLLFHDLLLAASPFGTRLHEVK